MELKPNAKLAQLTDEELVRANESQNNKSQTHSGLETPETPEFHLDKATLQKIFSYSRLSLPNERIRDLVKGVPEHILNRVLLLIEKKETIAKLFSVLDDRTILEFLDKSLISEETLMLIEMLRKTGDGEKSTSSPTKFHENKESSSDYLVDKAEQVKIDKLLSKGFTEEDIFEWFPKDLHAAIRKYIRGNSLSSEDKTKIDKLLAKEFSKDEILEYFPQESQHGALLKYIDQKVEINTKKKREPIRGVQSGERKNESRISQKPSTRTTEAPAVN